MTAQHPEKLDAGQPAAQDSTSSLARDAFSSGALAPALRWGSLLALGLILLVGAGLRFPLLGSIPPGLWFDEALNGQDAVAVWQPGGHFKLVYPDEFPREPLYETALALVVKAAGPSVTAMRSLSAVIGTLTILLLYLMLRREADGRVALCAAGVLATLRWHVIFSRLVFRTLILGPWMLGLTWAALAFRRKPTAGRAVLLGALVGGGFYTYLAWYFLLPAVLGILVWLTVACLRHPGPHVRRNLALVFLAGALVYLPLGVHYLRFPEHLLARPGAVSVFSGGVRAGVHEILKNAGEALLMFHWRGDHVAKHNIPHQPALDPVQGVAFLLGLGLTLAAAWRRRPLALILLGWLGCGLAATVFTHTDSPNFLRTLCLTPAVAILAGLGLAGAWGMLARRLSRPLATLAVAAALCVSASMTARDVYARWPGTSRVWEEFLGGYAQLARFAAAAPADVAVYVPQLIFEHRSFQFMTLGHANIYSYRDWSLLAPWPPSLREQGRPRPRRRWVIVTANNGLLAPLESLVPRGGVIEGFKAPAGNTWAAVFAVPEDQLPPPAALKDLQRRWRGEMGF